MCEFCEMMKKDIISNVKQSIDSIGTIVCGIYGNLLKVSCIVQIPTGICTPILGEAEINYCPMCGRELSEVTEMTNKDIEHAKETIDRITEELKHSKDYITQLKHDLDKTYNQLMESEKESEYYKNKINTLRARCHESARDSFDNGNYGILHIVTADELKTLNSSTDSETDRLVRLSFDALETANMLINATYKADMPFIEKKYDRNLYDIDDLEQIAEHLLVYCKHNREEDGK